MICKYFIPDVLLYNDYYPFGMLVPNRNASSAAYRYGFQGQEKDDEIKGEGNSYAFTFRFHDPRVGRFFTIDPLTNQYPWYTPYSFSGNKVIAFTELEGKEEKPAIRPSFSVKSELKPTVANDAIVKNKAREILNYKGEYNPNSSSSSLASLDKSLRGSGESSFGKWLQGKGETISYDGYDLYTDNSKGRSSNDGKIGPQATSGDITSVNVTGLWQMIETYKPSANQATKFKSGDGKTNASLLDKYQPKNLVTNYYDGKKIVKGSDVYKMFDNLGNNILTFTEKVTGDTYRFTIDTATKNGQEFTVMTSEGIQIDTLANGGVLHTTIRDVKSFTALSLREKDSIIKSETSKLRKTDSTSIEKTKNENRKKKI